MPKTGKVKLNPLRPFLGAARAVSNFYKREKDLASIVTVVPIVVGAMIGMVGLMQRDAVMTQDNETMQTNIMADIDAANNIELQDQFFQVASPHVVTLNSAGTDYVFDFGTEFVKVDGPDDADNSFAFAHFPNPDLIRRAHQAGTSIANNFAAAMNASISEQEQTWLSLDGEHQTIVRDHRTRIESTVKSFGENHSAVFNYNVLAMPDPSDNDETFVFPSMNDDQMNPFVPTEENIDNGINNAPDSDIRSSEAALIVPLPQPKAGG